MIVILKKINTAVFIKIMKLLIGKSSHIKSKTQLKNYNE